MGRILDLSKLGGEMTHGKHLWGHTENEQL